MHQLKMFLILLSLFCLQAKASSASSSSSKQTLAITRYILPATSLSQYKKKSSATYIPSLPSIPEVENRPAGFQAPQLFSTTNLNPVAPPGPQNQSMQETDEQQWQKKQQASKAARQLMPKDSCNARNVFLGTSRNVVYNSKQGFGCCTDATHVYIVDAYPKFWLPALACSIPMAVGKKIIVCPFATVYLYCHIQSDPCNCPVRGRFYYSPKTLGHACGYPTCSDDAD